MQTTPITTGTFAAMLAVLVIWALAAGFDTDVSTALIRTLPLIIISGVVTALATAMARQEIA